ncbi:hypothetical protein M885DRAFT_512561 [Pelagophyceae sp. CCMP2097]|nr:hypothetical protein M885DRAFT_512561 [Pelagophyceae sp. CCMP2097]
MSGAMGPSASAPSLATQQSIATLKTSMTSMTSTSQYSAYSTASAKTVRNIGPLQPIVPRATTKASVVYDSGGSDFRCPHQTSSLGKQVLSWPHTQSAGRVTFGANNRFKNEMYRSPGPKYSGPSSLGRQAPSKRPSLPAHGFGTSTRAGALKQYAVWSNR